MCLLSKNYIGHCESQGQSRSFKVNKGHARSHCATMHQEHLLHPMKSRVPKVKQTRVNLYQSYTENRNKQLLIKQN